MVEEGGLLKIDWADLADEEEDEDYVPQAKEIEEYNREKKEDKNYKHKKTDEETLLIARENWAKTKVAILEEENNKRKAILKQSQKLLRDKNLLKQVSETALNLNREEKQRKVIFAGQEFIVDANGEIVGRADEQAHLKEFQLFDGNNISQIDLAESQQQQLAQLKESQIEQENIKIEVENNKEKKEGEESDKIEEETAIVLNGADNENAVEVTVELKEEDNSKQIDQIAAVQQEAPNETLEEKNRKGMKDKFTYLLFVMDKIQSKSKSISSIHKSKLDWKSFTKKEKLEKKFEQNRKAGYLEKQNFIAKATEKQKQISKQSRR